MNSSLPKASLAPLEYRYALDAAMSVMGREETLRVICGVTALADQVRQRIPGPARGEQTSAMIWVEPLADTWAASLIDLVDSLTLRASLAIVASRPLARIVPERRSWGERPLGLRPGGLEQLSRALAKAGFTLVADYGIHSPLSVGLSILSRLVERGGYPHLSDRLHFKARLRYGTTGPLAPFSTVALMFFRRG